MTVVIDASVTMAWLFVDERTPYSNLVLGQLDQSDAAVPAIWSLEVANTLVIAERRQRIERAEADEFVQYLVSLPIMIDADSIAMSFGPVLTLARQFGLSVYDASYLELAQRRGLPLATQDRRLAVCAAQLGIPLVADVQTP